MNLVKQYAIVTTLAAMLAVPGVGRAQSLNDLQTMQAFLEIVTSYFGIIESTYDVSSDPEKAAIMQMQKIQEVYEARGEKVRSVEVLRAVLDDTKNPTIRNAAYMLMSDTLKDAGRTDEALKLLQQGLTENLNAAK